jgi:hypothetical protein
MMRGTMRLGVKHNGEDNQSYAYNTAWETQLTNTENLCGEGSEPWSSCRAGGMPALVVHLRELAPMVRSPGRVFPQQRASHPSRSREIS